MRSPLRNTGLRRRAAYVSPWQPQSRSNHAARASDHRRTAGLRVPGTMPANGSARVRADVALTFDDVLLVRRVIRSRTRRTSSPVAVHARHRAERPARLRGDGHGDRIGDGDRDGARRRNRRAAQEHVDRSSGGRSRSREALRERHDPAIPITLSPDATLREAATLMSRFQDLRACPSSTQDGPPRRHHHEPRPAVRAQPRSAACARR